MDITVLCTDPNHPVYPWLRDWAERQRAAHNVLLTTSIDDLAGGDILFLVSVSQLVSKDVRERFRASLVLHASDLPHGRGWSPHVWQILEGRSSVTVSVLDAEDAVDTGAIWAQRVFDLQGHELADEINQLLFSTEFALMDYIVGHFAELRPRPQGDVEATYYRKRTPADSRIDPSRSIAEQFDLLRVADPYRFPAFFDYRGCRYKIVIEKID